jgi:hypothetical protein
MLTPVRETELHGERPRGALLAQASLPPKAAETGKDKATSALARLTVRETALPLLVGGGGGLRLALAGRRLATRCVLVDEQRSRAAGGAACLVAGSDLVRWGNSSYASPDGLGPATDGAETAAAAALWRTRYLLKFNYASGGTRVPGAVV